MKSTVHHQEAMRADAADDFRLPVALMAIVTVVAAVTAQYMPQRPMTATHLASAQRACGASRLPAFAFIGAAYASSPRDARDPQAGCTR